MTSSLYKEFSHLMKGSRSYLTSESPLVVAVSGGSDSMALCLLLKKWCDEFGFPLHAVTVDHGLRAEAADEARLVGKWCQSHDIPHKILTGNGKAPQSGIQAYARELRYGLMEAACLALKTEHLFLGHQQEDQIETFLMRLSRGSGLSGLISMQPVSSRGALRLHRPLLSVSRHELREYLLSINQDWVEDPSNEDTKYTRTALGPIRQKLSHLPGADARLLNQSMDRMARAEQAIKYLVNDLWQEGATVSPLGYAAISSKTFQGAPAEVKVRLMERAVNTVSGNQFPVRLSEVERLVLSGDLIKPATLGGCQIMPRQKKLLVAREPGRNGLPQNLIGKTGLISWDHRFQINYRTQAEQLTEKLTIAEIGAAGWHDVGLEMPDFIAELPAVIRNHLPVVRKNGKIVSAPLIWPEIPGTGIARGQIEMVFNSKIVLN